MKRIVIFLRENLSAQRVGLLLALLALVVGVWGYIDQHESFNISLFLRDFSANISTELASIAITVLIIDELNRQRSQRQEEMQRKKQRLKKLMRSPSRSITRAAIEDLKKSGWLYDGWLDGAYLSYSNLASADLHRASLQGARLKSVKAQGTNLSYADLQGAGLTQAKLQGADLRHADVEEASFKEAEFDESTILPDGSRWCPETVMARFTDRSRTDFWRSNDPNSPAYEQETDSVEAGVSEDDLTKIEGIGPKIAEILRQASIDTYTKLAASSEDTLQEILRSAGLPYAPSLPTWREQAAYAAQGDWKGLQSLQDELSGGRRKNPMDR